MSNSALTPIELGLNNLEITAEERDTLYKNLVIPAKLYSAYVQTEGSTVRVFKRINPELFVLKVLEHNVNVINALASTRNFYMNTSRNYTNQEVLIYLTNGLIVKGGIGYNPYENPVAILSKPSIFVKCLIDDVESVIELPISDAVIINKSLTADEMDKVQLFESTYINSITSAQIDDMSRTRNGIKQIPTSQSGGRKR